MNKREQESTNQPIPTSARQRRWFRRCFGLVMVLIPFGVALFFAGQVPEFYRIRLSRDDYSVERSDLFFNRGTRFVNKIYNAEGRWNETFDEVGLNAWLAHDFKRNLSSALPAGVSEPRVALEDGRISVGYRWGIGIFSTVIHVAIKTWVPKNNQVAIELQGAWAGQVPLPTTYVRNVFERLAESGGLEITWHRHGSRLIGLLKVPVPRTGRHVLLRRAEIGLGTLTLAGQNLSATATQERKSLVR